MEWSTIVLYLVLAVGGGFIGYGRISLKEEVERETEDEHKNLNRLIAYIILSIAIAIIAGIFVKHAFSANPEVILGSGLLAAYMGHTEVSKLAYKLVLKKLGLNGNGNGKKE